MTIVTNCMWSCCEWFFNSLCQQFFKLAISQGSIENFVWVASLMKNPSGLRLKFISDQDNKVSSPKVSTFNPFIFHSQDLVNNSPYCLPYNSCDVSLENLVLDQVIIPISYFSLLWSLFCLMLLLLLHSERRKEKEAELLARQYLEEEQRKKEEQLRRDAEDKEEMRRMLLEQMEKRAAKEASNSLRVYSNYVNCWKIFFLESVILLSVILTVVSNVWQRANANTSAL